MKDLLNHWQLQGRPVRVPARQNFGGAKTGGEQFERMKATLGEGNGRHWKQKEGYNPETVGIWSNAIGT